MIANLDAEYGLCMEYQRGASESELSVNPRSLQVLDNATAPYLRSYMETAEGLFLPQVFHTTTPILWLIDEKGDVRFALEEVMNGDTGALTYILPRNGPPMRPIDVRLGHPSLLEPVPTGSKKSARIGGEIIYDPVRQDPRPWVITNNSGRFGKRPHIKRNHLENANRVFERHGILLRAFFIYTKEASGETL